MKYYLNSRVSCLLGNADSQINRWLSYAIRPMRMVELQHAVAIETGDEEFFDDGLSPEHMIISSCAGLVALESNTGMVRFINMAVQEHLPGLTAD